MLLGLSWKIVKKQRKRVVIGILGIFFSSFLTTSVAILNDSLGYSAISMLAEQVGDGDIYITRKEPLELENQPYFEQQDLLDAIKDIDEIQDIHFRILDFLYITNKEQGEDLISCYGINFSNEQKLKFEPWKDNATGKEYTASPKDGHCLLTTTFAASHNISAGSNITIRWRQFYFTFIVDKIIARKTDVEVVNLPLIVFSLEFLQKLFNVRGRSTLAIIRLKNSGEYYNTKNIPQSINSLRDIGVKVGKALPSDYDYYLPKYIVLQAAEIIFIPLTVLYWFIMIITLIIGGLLVYGIILTSSEELIYEFGVLRTFGGKKRHIYAIVLSIGLTISILGTLFGTLAAIAATPWIVPFFIGFFDFGFLTIEIVYLTSSLLQSSIILCVMSFLISLIPAYKAFKIPITDCLNPFRSNDNKIHIKKEGAPNKKFLILGIIISVLGSLFFFVMPTLIAYLNFFFFGMIFVVLLILMLVGFCFIIIHFIPYIELAFHYILKKFVPKFKKTYPISKAKIRKAKDKELVQKISVTVSFIFIFFITNMIVILPQLTTETLVFQYGSDIVISNTGSDEKRQIDQEFLNDTLKLPGVLNAAPVRMNCIDLVLLVNGEIDNLKLSTNQTITPADLIKYRSRTGGLVGITEDFFEVINTNHIEIDSNIATMKNLFSSNESVIISTALAEDLGLETGDYMRIETYNSATKNFSIYKFKVIGISGGIPGFWNFREGFYTAFLQPGMMVSMDMYNILMELPSNYTIYDKIMVDVKGKEDIDKIEKSIQNYFGTEYEFGIDDPHSKIEVVIQIFEILQLIFTIILSFAVIISLFTFYSNSLRTIQEKQREFGIMQILGLRRNETRIMYFKELMITMLSSASLGTIFGLFLANFIKFELAYIIETPFTLYVPWEQIGTIFLLTSVFGGLGSWLIIHIHTRKPLIKFLNRFS
jgi:ABC-type antimicrobial peptide transport system permease subunit